MTPYIVVVTLLAGQYIHNIVATDLLRTAIATTAIAIFRIAIIAHLTYRHVYYAITTALVGTAIMTAVITIPGIAIVAHLADRHVHDAIATDLLRTAITTAAIATFRIAVVAHLFCFRLGFPVATDSGTDTSTAPRLRQALIVMRAIAVSTGNTATIKARAGCQQHRYGKAEHWYESDP